MDSHPERVPSDSEEKPPRMAAKTNEGGSPEASRRLASGEKGQKSSREAEVRQAPSGCCRESRIFLWHAIHHHQTRSDVPSRIPVRRILRYAAVVKHATCTH